MFTFIFQKYNIRQAQVSFVGHILLYFLNLLRANQNGPRAAFGPRAVVWTPLLYKDSLIFKTSKYLYLQCIINYKGADYICAGRG